MPGRVGASAPTRPVALALAVVAAVGLTACTTTTQDSVTSVAPATAAAPPSTVPPLVTTAAPPAPPAPAPSSSVPPTTVLSPLAADLGPRFSVLPEPVAALPDPVSLTIDGIRLNAAPVISVGIAPDGELEVPDETAVGWYRLGSRPGQAGAVVLAAHVSWNGARGLFEQLGRLEPGERAVVTLTDGSTRTYEVVERTMYGKEGLPAERIWTREGPETLVLITCGGTFNPALRSYRDNIVVYAVPVA